MTWLFLLLASLFEIVWASAMKLSDGFSNLKFSLLTGAAMLGSLAFLALALKKLPLGLAYPIWTGIGAVGTILVGVFLFKENVAPVTWLFLGFLVVGLVGLKLTSGH